MRSFQLRALGPARALGAAVFAAVLTPSVLVAQASGLGQQSLRPYWHVFAAYTLVILLVAAWAFSIGRRLKDVENRLSD